MAAPRAATALILLAAACCAQNSAPPTATLHAVIKEWIVPRLPRSREGLETTLSALNAQLLEDLKHLKTVGPDSLDRLDLLRPPEDPDKLLVIVGVTVPCGRDDAAYLFDYRNGPPRSVFESHASHAHEETLDEVRISKPDSAGRQSILTLRSAVQCGSSWNRLVFDWFHLAPVQRIFHGEHDIWFGAGDSFQVKLDRTELLLEVIDRSIDAGLHSRQHVLHFRLAGTKVERIDPVALQPQDFVDEWLTQPWTEMASRSAAGKQTPLQNWHRVLTSKRGSTEFQFVQQCTNQNLWQIGIDLDKHGTVYFLVRQASDYRFTLEDVSATRQPGCPGDSPPNLDRPAFFPR